MTTTDSNGIIRYETSDPVSPLHTLLNLGMSSVSAAVTAVATGTTGTAFTPSITGPASINYGSGASLTGRWQRNGKLVTGRLSIVFGTGMSVSAGDWYIQLPVASVSPGVIGTVWAATAPGVNAVGALQSIGSTNAVARMHDKIFVASASNPWVWAAGGSIAANFSYEAA